VVTVTVLEALSSDIGTFLGNSTVALAPLNAVAAFAVSVKLVLLEIDRICDTELTVEFATRIKSPAT
jgi:hypothetical protein